MNKKIYNILKKNDIKIDEDLFYGFVKKSV